MTDKPDLIDNLEGNTMVAALRQLLNVESGDASIVIDPSAKIDEARIATAYFSPEGFAQIASSIASISSIKLLLGSDPIADSDRWQRKLEETEQDFVTRKLHEGLKSQEESLRAERDHIPFNKKSRCALKQLVSALRSGNIEVRRFEDNFLHAKAYIFSPANENKKGKPGAVIIGSSNLTAAGLSYNLELNSGRYDMPIVAKAKNWFDQLWDKAEEFDLAAFFEEVFEAKTPFEIFLRVLWELYGDEVKQDVQLDGLPLTSFQKHGVVRALRLINENGGVIVADEVGLGKTFIAGEILSRYKERRQRALLICPAALRGTSWAKFISDYELHLEVVSFEQLSRDKQLWDKNRRPKATSKHLERNIGEYQLIIIDEAHNYRNPDSPNRADALRALLHGKRKDLLMLTATPVNNSLWDLYHLTRFFLKQDAFLASKGILSIHERFNEAMKKDPDDLSPDLLYPIIDATTVKRTRQFIKKHYRNDQVKINDEWQMIVFPETKAISVRYDLDSLMPGLFDLIETYFDPKNPARIRFARYKTKAYLKKPNLDDAKRADAATGLILSGLLKRFESSTGAFCISIERLIDQHERFVKEMDKGNILSTELLAEASNLDDESFKNLLELSDKSTNPEFYKINDLRNDVNNDLDKLKKIQKKIKNITPAKDPKLKALGKQLEKIAAYAEEKGISDQDIINKRKVIIFSFFADTVSWIKDYLDREIADNEKLIAYKKRFETVIGGEKSQGRSKDDVAARFAPVTAGGDPEGPDELDILISTDVLAEGVNLQQAQNIINYDMPWNPMKLVQRHGRIDRIGSKHDCVFMRTIFPVDRLDDLLNLEKRISQKIAMAAASVGIVSPIAEVKSDNRDFTETKKEIQKLLEEDSTLYERGRTEASTQSGEEYRQTLREELEKRGNKIAQMPWKAGSGMKKGSKQGVFFCAKVGNRTYLRFVHADKAWKIRYEEIYDEEQDKLSSTPMIEGEIGRCLRLIECDENKEIVLDEFAQDAAYDLWLTARDNVYEHWKYETDPANLQPPVRPLNREVADFIRSNMPIDMEKTKIETALDIIESPWPRRDEFLLREWFDCDKKGAEKSKYLVQEVIDLGLEPFVAPVPLPPIYKDDIELLVWMAITT